MKKFRPQRIFISATALLAGLELCGGALLAQEKAPEAPSPVATLLAGLNPGPSGVAFLTKKTRLWLGRSQVVCFYARQKPDEDRFFSFDADENYLHVLIPPTLAPGSNLGYIRLRPLKEGHTQITLAGATLNVEIVKDTSASTLEVTRPEIVSPAQGAVVWGKFVVGVERLNLSTAAPPPAPVLRLSDGREIAAEAVPDQEPGPYLRYAFTVDAKSLAPGSNALVAVDKEDSGHEIVSDPLDIVAFEPKPTAILAGDCKDQVHTHWPQPKVPFAYPQGEFQPLPPANVVADVKSTFGSVVSSQNDNPPWALPVTVPAKGLYEMMVTARGDMGGNALPSIGLMIDGAQNPATTARLATTQWQRIPVGHPVMLEAGNHVLLVRFRNGFNSNPTDVRRLYLARYELAALTPAAAPPPVLASNGPGNTMQGAPMQETLASASPPSEPLGPGAIMPAAAPPGEPMMQGAMMMQSPGAGDAMMQPLAPAGSFHVVFRDGLEGQIISNQVQISAMCWWPNRDHSPPPTVDLLVNNKVVSSLTTANPRFQIDVSAFRPGENKVELQAMLPNGQRARSTVENLILPQALATGEPFRRSYKYYVYDPAWEGSLGHLIKPGNPGNPNNPDSVAEFNANGDATLKLPDDLEGLCKVSIEARRDDVNAPAEAAVFLSVNGQETKLGDVPAGAKMAVVPVAETTFLAGPKTLIVRYANDTGQPGRAPSKLDVRSVQMDPVKSESSPTHPVAAVVYPPSGARLGLADAVVADVSGHHGLVHADLLIDGQPQHFNLQATNGLGPILFPLLTRDLTPGPHELQIAVKDDAGNTGQSNPVDVVFTGKDDDASSSYSRAVYLLNRFGYGPEPRELAAILTMGPHAWLEARVNETIDSPSEENERERVHAEFPDVYAAVPRAVQYLLTDANPVRARFLVWTENHFSTWLNKDGVDEKSREHDRFLELGIAPFPDLLLASATSPAMLIYLDQRNSVAHRLNENYAREIMELHTLGVKGGYTQKDVTTLADLLTGWTLADEAPTDGSENLERTFRYNPYLNSGNACQILGMEFPGVPLDHRFDRVLTALNMLAAHPSCAFFISRKLAEHYVSDPAPPQLVNDLARIYMESGGDLRAMLVALPDEPEFWTAGARVASPIDFSVRLARLARMNNPGPVNDLLSHSGMGMFDRATPDGYPDADGYFSSSNALLQRWHYAQTIQNNFLANGLIPNDWRPADNQWVPATTQRLVDLAAVRITGSVLTPSSNDAALQLLAAAPVNTNTDARLHLLTTFLCQVPETSLR